MLIMLFIEINWHNRLHHFYANDPDYALNKNKTISTNVTLALKDEFLTPTQYVANSQDIFLCLDHGEHHSNNVQLLFFWQTKRRPHPLSPILYNLSVDISKLF